MMAARDEARARIAARLGLIGGAGYAAPGAPVPANVRADTLAEERALGGREQTGRASWWGVGRPLPNERRIVGGRIVVRQQSGNGGGGRAAHPDVTTGWRAGCACEDAGDPLPAVVLDPFCGSGTVSLVARKHGRHSIGIDLSAAYLELARERLGQLALPGLVGG
jgi:SAM-dependent methyltransferase